jgi:hypothetical protein
MRTASLAKGTGKYSEGVGDFVTNPSTPAGMDIQEYTAYAKKAIRTATVTLGFI